MSEVYMSKSVGDKMPPWRTTVMNLPNADILRVKVVFYIL